MRIVGYFGKGCVRLGGLLKLKRKDLGEREREFQKVVEQALREINEEWGM